MKEGPPEDRRSDDDSLTSDFGSATGSDVSETESSEGSFARSENTRSTQHESANDRKAGVGGTSQIEKPVVAILSDVSSAPDRQPAQPDQPADEKTLDPSSGILRRLSQTALALSSSEVTQLASKAAQLPQQTAEQHDSQSPSGVTKQTEGAEGIPACNIPPAMYQASEKPDGKQARLQLEDMLTRIEMHFQAEKSARMEAEARCAAALEALRQAGGPNSRAASQVAGSALPVKFAEKARESIAEARGLVASMCTLLEEVEVVRHQAHIIQARMDTLLQELPAESHPEDMQQEWSRGLGGSAWGSMGGQSPSRAPPKPPALSVTGVDRPERPGLRQERNTPKQSLRELRESILLTSLQWDGRGRPQRQVPGRAVDQSSGTFSRSISPGKIGYQHDSFVSNRGTDAPGPDQNARSPGQKPSLGPSQSLAPRAGSPKRKQLDRPQRWETSTNFIKAVQ